MRVPRYNFVHQHAPLVEGVAADFRRLLLEGDFILNRDVEAFESAFGDWLGVEQVLGLNSGTDALVLALRAAGVGSGDEVITQANTFYATVAAILLSGAKPVLVDARADDFLIDASALAQVATARTRAIIPVHLYGKATEMDPILSFARDRDIIVIEDAAQSHGAKSGGRAVGTLGDVGCFSFHPSKNLAAAGDAGALATQDRALGERTRRLRSLGQKSPNEHVVVGINSKLDAIQARLLLLKLPYLNGWNESRRTVAGWYHERLSGLPVSFQATAGGDEHVFHLFQVRTAERDRLLTHLVDAGVDAVIRYPTPIHLQEAFQDLGYRVGSFPVAETLADELLCLPIRPDMTVDEVDYVAGTIHDFFGGGS